VAPPSRFANGRHKGAPSRWSRVVSMGGYRFRLERLQKYANKEKDLC
jgi:hypothetical protein